MQQNYDEALARLLKHEGGYDNHPSDPGGPTKYGITIHDYRRYINPKGTAEDVRNMTVDQAKKIYRERYADPLRFDELPGGVDYGVFDYGVNSGISRSAKVLQRLTNVPDDGTIGPATVAAARARDPLALVDAICDERMKFLKGLKTWPVFGNGWSNRVRDVRNIGRVMAGAGVGVQPNTEAPFNPYMPPWLQRANALMGLYEFPGGKDNPAILAMAKACGGQIARNYKHDSIPWCKLFVNYCLVSAGFKSDDSLWALDTAKYGIKLKGPAVGALACQKRNGGGHVYFVAGRTPNGMLVGRGGNQSDMVCDTAFDPDLVVSYNWPVGYPLPQHETFERLPVMSLTPRVHKDITSLPPVTYGPTPGKGEVAKPTTADQVKNQVGPAAGQALWLHQFWDWVVANPLLAGGIFITIALISAVGVSYYLERRAKQKQEAATPDIAPVAA